MLKALLKNRKKYPIKGLVPEKAGTFSISC
jgi:hypothetical protein